MTRSFSVGRLLGLESAGKPWQRAALAAGLGLGGTAAQLAAFWQRPERPERPERATAEPAAGTGAEETLPA